MGKNAVFKNIYISTSIRKIIIIGCNIISLSLLNRYLGPEIKGQYSYVISIINVSVIFFQLGIFSQYPNYKKREVEGCSNIFFSICTYKFLITILLWLVLYTLSQLGYFADWSLGLWIFIIIAINAYQGEIMFMILIDDINKQNIATSIMAISNVVMVAICFLFINASVKIALFLFIAKSILGLLLCRVWKQYSLKKWRYIKTFIPVLIKVAIYPVLATILLDLNYRVDIFLLENMSTYYYVGIYSVAVNLAEIAWLIPDIFKDILFYKTSRDKSTESINFSLRISVTVVTVMILGVILLGKFFILLLFGDAYKEAYAISCLIFLGIPSMAIFKVLNPLFQVMGLWRQYVFVLLSGVCSNIILNFLLIPLYGMYGAAIATVLSYSICGLSLLYQYKHMYLVRIREVLFINSKDIRNIMIFLKGTLR